jgi:serine/threonine-protein kinase
MSEPASRLAAALEGRYTVERELGQGGMATVYLAHDVRHDRQVAIKVLHPELAAALGADRFLAEIKTTARLQHPHILPLLDSGAADGLLFYVMPFVTGETLRARLARERQLPIAVALRIAREVADALSDAHTHGIVHRDIKPENILLQGEHALVADFGIALAVQQAGGQRMTQTGLSLGTPQYMAPEQAMGDKSVDYRADVYALGAVTHEMLAGEPPFTGPTLQAIVAKVIADSPRPLRELRRSVPEHVEATVIQALEKLPADRFASAADFSAALGARTAATTQSSRTPVRQQWLAWAGWGAALVLAAVAAWSWRRGAPEPRAAMTRRVSIDVPLISDYRSARSPFALSTDGSVVVYAAVRGPAPAIHRRRMDELQSEPIRGTEGGTGPFISPDGGQLGFFRSNQLEVVPVAGGSPTPVKGSVVMPEGSPSWTSDGRIVYTSAAGSVVVSAPDGSRVDTLTWPTGPERHLSPIMLPNGRAVLYMVEGPDISDSRIDALNIATKQSKTIVTGGAMTPQYVDGFLFYARPEGADATLLALPFDAENVEARGEPIALGDPVNRSRFGTAQYAAARGVLMYHPRSETVLVESDERGVTTRLVSENGGWHHPRYSPDGTRIALDLAGTGGRDIWVFDRASKTLSRVTRVGDAHDPVWLPNGRELSFFSFRTGGFPLQITSADGSSDPRSVEHKGDFNPTDLVTPGAWLPDAKSYVGGVNDPVSLGDIWVIPVDGSKAERVVGSRFEEEAPAVSADGRWLAYQSNETGRVEVYVRSLRDAAFRVQVSNAGGAGPAWDPRRPIVYYTQLEEGRLRLQAVTLRTAPLSLASRHTVLDDVAIELSDNHANFDVHPSGKLFVFPQEQPTTGLVAIFDWAPAVSRARKVP